MNIYKLNFILIFEHKIFNLLIIINILTFLEIYFIENRKISKNDIIDAKYLVSTLNLS